MDETNENDTAESRDDRIHFLMCYDTQSFTGVITAEDEMIVIRRDGDRARWVFTAYDDKVANDADAFDGVRFAASFMRYLTRIQGRFVPVGLYIRSVLIRFELLANSGTITVWTQRGRTATTDVVNAASSGWLFICPEDAGSEADEDVLITALTNRLIASMPEPKSLSQIKVQNG